MAGSKRTNRVKVRMRLDAPVLEKKVPISSAMLASEVLEIDALADSMGTTRSELIRELAVQALALRAG